MPGPQISRIALIGAGAMGSALAKGLISARKINADQIIACDIEKGRLDAISIETGVSVTSSLKEAVSFGDIIILAVKPNTMPALLSDIASYISADKLVISIAAGITLEFIQGYFEPNLPIIRAMPNTPCLIREGVTGYSLGKYAGASHSKIAADIFEAVGTAIELPESMLDAVTGLSGSGPAFIYIAIEALADGGVKMGLPRAHALKIAAHTVLGAAKMVLTENKHPGELKDAVASPGGTTIAGITALEKSGFRASLISAVEAAAKRSEELSRS